MWLDPTKTSVPIGIVCIDKAHVGTYLLARLWYKSPLPQACLPSSTYTAFQTSSSVVFWMETGWKAQPSPACLPAIPLPQSSQCRIA